MLCLLYKKAAFTDFLESKPENNFLASVTATSALSCSATLTLYSAASLFLVSMMLANYDSRLSNLASHLALFFLAATNLGLNSAKLS